MIQKRPPTVALHVIVAALLVSLAWASGSTRFLLQTQSEVEQQREREALLEWKASLRYIDPSSYLNTWDENNAVCSGRWAGISCRANRVSSLFLGGNKCTGTLPKQLSALDQLWFVDLSENRFTGSLPLEYSVLNPSKLNLNKNLLMGQLPSEYSTMENLRELDLGGNFFQGSLPKAWSTLTMLNHLEVNGNRLTGELPQEWSTMRRLQEIDLAGNGFRGDIPETWITMGENLMEKVTMEYNPPPPPRPLPLPSPPSVPGGGAPSPWFPQTPPYFVNETGGQVPVPSTGVKEVPEESWPVWQIVTIAILGALTIAALAALITLLVCCCCEKKRQKKAHKAQQDLETAKMPLTYEMNSDGHQGSSFDESPQRPPTSSEIEPATPNQQQSPSPNPQNKQLVALSDAEVLQDTK